VLQATALARHLSSRHNVSYANFGEPPAPPIRPPPHRAAPGWGRAAPAVCLVAVFALLAVCVQLRESAPRQRQLQPPSRALGVRLVVIALLEVAMSGLPPDHAARDAGHDRCELRCRGRRRDHSSATGRRPAVSNSTATARKRAAPPASTCAHGAAHGVQENAAPGRQARRSSRWGLSRMGPGCWG
jgi:hypothetical protein